MAKTEEEIPDDIDQHHNESAAQAREWFRQEVATVGLRAAYKALKDVCEDPKAAAPAKATAGVALFRAAGAFANTDDESDIELDQMTAAQLARERQRLQRKIDRGTKAIGRTGGEATSTGDVEESGNGGVFE